MYVKNFFDGVSKKASQELTENIRQEMSLEIADLDWMDDKTRYLGWLCEVELTIFFIRVYKIYCIATVTVCKWELRLMLDSIHCSKVVFKHAQFHTPELPFIPIYLRLLPTVSQPRVSIVCHLLICIVKWFKIKANLSWVLNSFGHYVPCDKTWLNELLAEW